MALRDVMQHVVEVEKENRKRPGGAPSRSRTIALVVVCVVMAGASAYSWFARPEFIWGPRGHADTPTRAVASERSTLFLLSRRIESYKRANGSYPADLSVLGGRIPSGVTYALVSDGVYRLTARGPSGDVTYQSDKPADQFLGNSMRMLGGTRVQR